MKLKKIWIMTLSLLIIAGVGSQLSNVNVSARRVRSHRISKIKPRHYINRNNKRKPSRVKKSNKIHQKIRKRNVKNHLNKNKRNRQRNAKRLANRARRKGRRSKRAKKGNPVLKPRFKRSNNKRLLNQSGFVNLNKLESTVPEIASKYAPNSRKAVIPKKLNVNKNFWLQGKFPEPNMTIYQYIYARRGWVKSGIL